LLTCRKRYVWCGYADGPFEVTIETDSNDAVEIKTETDSNEQQPSTYFDMNV